MGNDEITIQLRKPVTLGEIVYSEITLKEPTAGQLEKSASADTGIGSVINLISVVAVIPRKVAQELCQRDFQEASGFLASFGAPETGLTL